MTEFLGLEEMLGLIVQQLGAPPPVRELGLLESALARPRATVFGDDAYPDLWTKAAALMQSVVVNHALVDGGRRMGWTAGVVFLGLNAEIDLDTLEFDTDDADELVIRIAADSMMTVDEIATRLRAVLEPDGESGPA